MKKALPIIFLVSTIFGSSCSQFASREPAALKVSLFPNLLGQNDKGYKLNETSRLCLNSKNKSGYNPGYLGECGDLTSISEKKLRKLDFTNANLKGAQLSGLNLSGLDLSGADLSFANIRGTNFTNSTFTNTKFKNAGYDDKTKGFQFSPDELRKLGLLKDGVAVIDTTAQAENEYGDLLTTQNFEAIKNEFKELTKPTERYHSKLFSLVKEAQEIDTAHLNLVLSVCFYKSADMKDVAKKLASTTDWTLAAQLTEKQQEIRMIGSFNNKILLVGLSKLSDMSLENLESLSQNIMFQDSNISKKIAEIIKKELTVQSADEIKAAIKILNQIDDTQMAASYGLLLFNNHTQKTKEDVIAVNALLEDGAKDYFIDSFLSTVSSLSTEELHTYADLSYSNGSNIRASNISKVNDLSEEKVIGLLDKTTYGNKDTILTYYLKKMVVQIPFENFFKLVKMSYEKNLFTESYLSKIENLNTSNIVALMGLVDYNNKDSVAKKYMDEFVTKISTKDLMAISTSAYSTRDELRYNNLSKVTDLTTPNATFMARACEYNNKDILIIKYLQSAKEVSAQDFLPLVQSAYSQKNDIIVTYWTRISAVQITDIIKIAKEGAEYNAKDLLINSYLKTVIKINSAGLVALSAVSYSQSNDILTAGLPKISTWDQSSALSLVRAAQYNTKDTVIDYYLSKIGAVTTKDLIEATEASYSRKEELRMKYYVKISDFTLENSLVFSQAVSYNNTDIVLKSWLDKEKKLTAAQLIKALPYFYSNKEQVILDNHVRLVDLNYNSTLALVSLLNWGNKDIIISSFLRTKPSLTAAQIQELINASYNIKKQIGMDNLDLVVGLTTDDVVKLSANYSWGDKDEFLLVAIKKIKNLSQDDIIKLSELGYNKKNEIIKIGIGLL